jgi:hypothetical protein
MTNNAMQENELCMLIEQGRNRETHTDLIDRHCFDTTTTLTRTPLAVKLCFKYSALPVLRRWSAAARLLRLWVRIPPGHICLFLVSILYCQVEVYATR